MAISPAGCKTVHRYRPHHMWALISVPGVVLTHLEVLVPEMIARHWDRLSRKIVLSSVLEKVFKKQLENCCQAWYVPTSSLRGSGPFQPCVHELVCTKNS